MRDKQFLTILSMQMATTKMLMQVLACLLNDKNYKAWEKAFESMKKEFKKIEEEIINEDT